MGLNVDIEQDRRHGVGFALNVLCMARTIANGSMGITSTRPRHVLRL